MIRRILVRQVIALAAALGIGGVAMADRTGVKGGTADNAGNPTGFHDVAGECLLLTFIGMKGGTPPDGSKIAGGCALQYNYGIVQPPDPSMPGALARSGYIHPIWTPSGKMVSSDFRPDHPHQQGVWLAWKKNEYEGRHPNYWEIQAGEGKVAHKSLDSSWADAKACGFRATRAHIDLTGPDGPQETIRESWDVRANPGGLEKGTYYFDLTTSQSVVGDSPFTVAKYRYGGLAFRGAKEWDKGAEFLTSEGTGREGNFERARWVRISGPVDGGHAGVVIFCHPGNPRFPEYVRINPEDPFVCFAPAQKEPLVIEPGIPYVARYRFLVFDGEMPVEEIERRWHDYAEPTVASAIKRTG